MVSWNSIGSIYIQQLAPGGKELGTATGFVVHRGGKHFLITNYHVASGRSRVTGQPEHPSMLVPVALRCWLREAATIPQVSWLVVDVPVLEVDGDGVETALWRTHPLFGRTVDVVAIELAPKSDVHYHPYSLDAPVGLQPALLPAGDVSVIGFPFGALMGVPVAVWIRGTVASEPELNYDGLPAFLIDARTRGGASGSPAVLAFPGGGMTPLENGTIGAIAPGASRLFGVYSGRVNTESDIGIVWNMGALRAVVDHGVPGKAGVEAK